MKINHIFAIIAVLGGLSAAFTNHSEKNNLYPTWDYEKARVEGDKVHYISVTEVADILYHKDQNMVLLDVREKEAYQAYHLPTAIRVESGDLASDMDRKNTYILYGDDKNSKVFELESELKGKVYVMKGGIEKWYSMVLFPDFIDYQIRNSDRLLQVMNTSRYFGGTPQNSQLLNITVRKSRYREGC